MTPIFITGTGTGIGKTIIAAIITEALQADYWKPVQAGFENGTDSLLIKQLITNKKTIVHPEAFLLKMAASPHIASEAEKKSINIKDIILHMPRSNNQLVIEGAGGLMVPLNSNEFVTGLIKKLKARVIIISKNELGSINHSLLTAAILKKEKINVAGWIFNGEYLDYENEIAMWSGYPRIGSINDLPEISKDIIKTEAEKLKPFLQKII